LALYYFRISIEKENRTVGICRALDEDDSYNLQKLAFREGDFSLKERAGQSPKFGDEKPHEPDENSVQTKEEHAA